MAFLGVEGVIAFGRIVLDWLTVNVRYVSPAASDALLLYTFIRLVMTSG